MAVDIAAQRLPAVRQLLQREVTLPAHGENERHRGEQQAGAAKAASARRARCSPYCSRPPCRSSTPIMTLNKRPRGAGETAYRAELMPRNHS